MATSKIIDGYYKDNFNLQRLKDEGIVAIIHKATQGTDFADPKYKERRDTAKGLGLLWGAFHFSTDTDGSSRSYTSLTLPNRSLMN